MNLIEHPTNDTSEFLQNEIKRLRQSYPVKKDDLTPLIRNYNLSFFYLLTGNGALIIEDKIKTHKHT